MVYSTHALVHKGLSAAFFIQEQPSFLLPLLTCQGCELCEWANHALWPRVPLPPAHGAAAKSREQAGTGQTEVSGDSGAAHQASVGRPADWSCTAPHPWRPCGSQARGEQSLRTCGLSPQRNPDISSSSSLASRCKNCRLSQGSSWDHNPRLRGVSSPSHLVPTLFCFLKLLITTQYLGIKSCL